MDASFDDLLVTGATWLLVAGLTWGAAIVVALALELVSRGRVRATWACPPALRRSLLAGLGLLLSGGALGLPATAAPARPGPLASGTSGLPVPSRPLGGPPREARAAPDDRVVVRPGDTLWHLAAGALGRRARSGDVARLVRRMHARNRAVIGPDADLIRPGQRLTVPPLREDQP